MFRLTGQHVPPELHDQERGDQTLSGIVNKNMNCGAAPIHNIRESRRNKVMAVPSKYQD
jgi:hypothetical protein